MKESIETIPLMDAFGAGDECPFCYLRRQAEQHAISFIMGSAYMEDNIRMATDATGFCRHHYKMMYDYGNRLGSALILSTHLRRFNEELKEELEHFSPKKNKLLTRVKEVKVSGKEPKTALGAWIREKEKSCYVCQHYDAIYDRYLNTFFWLYRRDEEFRKLFLEGKGFCLPHFGDLMESAEDKLTEKEKEEFYPIVFRLMQENMERMQEEVSWFVDKNDYLHKNQSWGNSADSVPRAMQKCCGGYPSDPIFKQKN